MNKEETKKENIFIFTVDSDVENSQHINLVYQAFVQLYSCRFVEFGGKFAAFSSEI